MKGIQAEQELRALVEVKTVQMEVSVQEMFDTADVLARLSADMECMLLLVAHVLEQDEDDARDAGKGAKRALMVGAAACQMMARALEEKEKAETGGNAPEN